MLEAAAVVGRWFDDRLAWQASGRSEDEAAAALEEALRGQLIVEREDGYYFTHDKIQEVAYANLSIPRRRLLHRRVAEARESLVVNLALYGAAGFDPVIARSTKYTFKDHGLEWDNSGKNAFYSRFAYNG